MFGQNINNLDFRTGFKITVGFMSSFYSSVLLLCKWRFNGFFL